MKSAEGALIRLPQAMSTPGLSLPSSEFSLLPALFKELKLVEN